MKNKTTTIIFKAVALAVSWLTLSPIFLILDGRWKLLPKWLRMLLFFLSPLMLIVFVAVLIACFFFYCEYFYPRYFVKPKVVENITGVAFPKYKVVDCRQNNSRMDKSNSFILEFKEMPDETFYRELDEHFDCFEPGKYSYSAIWGNGIEAPKGESDKDDISFSVDIESGSKTFHIRVMEW